MAAVVDDDSNTQDDSIPAAVPVPKAKLTRLNLNIAGSALLKDFFETVSTHPTLAQKDELLVKILALGNEFYDMKKISKWFMNTRSHKGITKRGSHSLKRFHETPHPTDDLIHSQASVLDAQVESVRSRVVKKGASENPIGPPYKSLPRPPPIVSQMPVLLDYTNVSMTKNLEELFRETPYPTDDTLKVWARNLGLTIEVVRDWVHTQRISPHSQELFYDYTVQEVENRGPVQDHIPLSPYKDSLLQTHELAMNGPFPLPPTLVPPEALSLLQIPHLEPVDQNRRLLFDIAERMDLGDLPITPHASISTSLFEPGPCGQPQESSSKAMTMTREAFLSNFGPMETKMRRFMDQVRQSALETEGWDRTFVPGPNHFKLPLPLHDL